MHPDIPPTDVHWVGAWWIAPLFGAILLLFPTLLILGYPKEFPDTNKVRIKKQQDADFVHESESSDVSMFNSAKKLFRNRLLMLVYIGRVYAGI